MDTIELSQERVAEITSKGRYLATNQIGTKSARLYQLESDYYVIWYKRSVNFVAVHKAESVSLNTARMLFPFSV